MALVLSTSRAFTVCPVPVRVRFALPEKRTLLVAVTAPPATKTPAFSYSVAAKARKVFSSVTVTKVFPSEPAATALMPALLPMAHGRIAMLSEP